MKTRPSRAYADEAIRAGSHPTRRTILKSLQESDCTTIQLEELTGENRYNLYHHLTILKDAGLVDTRLVDGRVKKYHLRRSERPQAVFFQVSLEEQGRSRGGTPSCRPSRPSSEKRSRSSAGSIRSR